MNKDLTINQREAQSHAGLDNPERPVLRWIQSDTRVLLKIYLTNVLEFDRKLRNDGRTLTFKVVSRHDQQQEKKLKRYEFTLTLYLRVYTDGVRYCKHNRYVTVDLEKRLASRWPQLTLDGEPTNWVLEGDEKLERHIVETQDGVDDVDELIFVDKREAFKEIERRLREFNEISASAVAKTRQANQPINEESSTQTATKHCDILNFIKNDLSTNSRAEPKTDEQPIENMKHDYRREQSTMDASRNTARQALNCKKVYLFLYNLSMFVLFLMVHMILTIKGLAGSMDDDSVQGAAFIVKLLTYTQLLESVHPMLGLVPGGPFMPFLQVIGRLLVNHFLSEPEIRQASAPYAHYLFIVWSSIEIFRYSYYALRVFNVEIYPITWSRYTLFLPLYPMGGFCESQIVLATVAHYEKTGEYSINLPNSANFSFVLPSFLRFYTVFLLGPSILYLMKYMWSQRAKQLKQKAA